MFYGVWLYEQAFTYFHMGYASALAWVLFVVTMLCTALLLWTSGAGCTTAEDCHSRRRRTSATGRSPLTSVASGC